jgi:hypothetical protein
MERNMRSAELWRLKTRVAGLLVARQGRYWLTRCGDSDDYVFVSGERFVLPPGEWLIQALTAGALEWTTAVSAPMRLTYETRHLSSVSGL